MQPQPAQDKILGLKDVVLMSFFANLGIRWIPVAAGIGPSSLLFWLIGALCFFLPFALIISELSNLYPEMGGMYAWIKHGLGKEAAFISAWCYWVVNFFYYPAILTFFASNFAYALLRPQLANNELFVTLVVIITFWILTIALLGGLKVSKWMTETGGIIGSLIPILLLMGLGGFALFYFHHSMTPISLQSLLPNQNIMGNLSTLSILMFAMAGLEVVPTFASSVHNPHRNLPRGLIISAILIFACYTLGTVAMNIIATPAEIQKTTGLISTFALINGRLHMTWLTEILACLLSFAELAALSLWIIAPAVMFFQCTEGKVLPPWLKKTNRHNMPVNAFILQAILVSVVILLTTLLPSVADMYQVLVLMTTALYFLPYVLLIFAYFRIKNRNLSTPDLIPGGRASAYGLGILTLISLLFGIGFCFVPTAGMSPHALFVYEAELIGGPVILVVAGMLFYTARRHHH